MTFLFIKGEFSYIKSLQKKCRNFKVVFQRSSAGILEGGKHLELLWNFDGIPLEYHRNTAADFVQIYRMFFRIIPMKYQSFFGGKNRNSYGIFVVF